MYVFRHAESEANVAGLIASDPATAVPGFGLTETGRRQAAEADLPWGSRPVRILTSDFRRARETAEIVARRCGAAVELEPLLRERGFAAFEGQSSDRYHDVWAWDARGEDCPGVETLASVVDRLDRLRARLAAEDDGRPVVLVSHGDVLQILLTVSAGLPPSNHRSIPHLKNAEARAVFGR